MIRESAVGSFLILATFALPAESIPGQGRTSITGVVFDSVAGRPLVGATVQVTGATGAVVGRTASAVTDPAGRYAIANLPTGL